jgi:hypothetical protein
MGLVVGIRLVDKRQVLLVAVVVVVVLLVEGAGTVL